jgi:hypothetical protein
VWVNDLTLELSGGGLGQHAITTDDLGWIAHDPPPFLDAGYGETSVECTAVAHGRQSGGMGLEASPHGGEPPVKPLCEPGFEMAEGVSESAEAVKRRSSGQSGGPGSQAMIRPGQTSRKGQAQPDVPLGQLALEANHVGLGLNSLQS